MRNWTIVAFVWGLSVNLWASPRAQHVFIISIDGGKPAVIAQSDMPVLKELARQGACTWQARTVLPSITLPSHTSMLTGVGPKKHKISWNSWKPRKGVVHVPTVFSQAKAAGFSTAMFVGKEKFRHLVQPGSVDCFDYNPELTGEINYVAGHLIFKTADTVSAGLVANDAATWIVQKKPNLCFIHLTDADNAGHKYGWGSPEQIKAFANIDAALGVILKGIRSAGIADESVLIITADHGGHRKTHGSDTPEDVMIPWIVWGKDVKKESTINASVTTCDTAATALWILGLPLPASSDGVPIAAAFN